MTPPASILSAYPADVAAGPWQHLGDAGGFSGARIWRSSGWRLKAWPRGDVSAEHLRQTHAWMRTAANLDFVPQPLTTMTGDTVVVDGAWTWDVVTWMPGEPLLREPTTARLTAAGRALAALHVAWETHGRTAPAPVIQRRLDALAHVPDVGERNLIALVQRHRAACIEALVPWQTIEYRLQPCLCDLRADHVLYEGDRVAGFIDFGSARVDHPAADLARLLGDCLPGDVRGWQPLLDGYHSVRPLSPANHALIGVLERTEPVTSLLTWIERSRQRPLTPVERTRLAGLKARIR